MTHNVSTMAQFLKALEDANDEDLIEVLADLNWDDVVDDVNTTTYLGGTNSQSHPINVTINGNNHTIYNLDRSFSSGNSIFTVRGTSTGFKVNNLSYLNCHLSGNTAFRIWTFGGSNATFIGGVIQGRFAGCPFSGIGIIRNFMLTFDYSKGNMMMGGSSDQCHFQNCWIKFNNCSYVPSSSNHIASDCKQCYFEGTVYYDSENNYGTMFYRLDSCCVNVQTDLGSTPSLNNIASYTAGTDTLPSIINFDKIPNTEHIGTSMLIMVSDEQMHDAEYLVSVGFDIIS